MKSFKKSTSLIVALLSVLTISGCQNVPDTCSQSVPNSDSQNSNTSLTSDEDSNSSFGFPYTSYPEAYPRDPVNGVTVIKQPNEAFPKGEMTFRVDSLDTEFYVKLSDLFEKGTDKRLLNSVYSLFLADVNNDGYLDFIYSTAGGRSYSTMGEWIGIFDYHNDKELYSLDDPCQYDYRLSFEEGKLCVTQYITDYYDSKNVLELGRIVGKGILDYSGSDITTKWENFLNIDSFNFSVTSTDKNRTPVALKATEEKDTFIVEHASVDMAYCITTNIVRNSGNYDDLTTNLPVGYRLNNNYYRLIQGTANNHQDNVIVSLEASYMKYKEIQEVTIEACVSGNIYKIIFQPDSLDYSASDKTLKDVLGWNFTKDELIKFTREYVSSSYKETTYPFVYVSVASNDEATKTSYAILEAIVAEIDPLLVKEEAEPTNYYFKTSNNEYTFSSHHSFIKCGDAFYSMIFSKNFSYAISASTGYYRFRDSHSQISVEPCVANLTQKVIQDANKIIFDDREMSKSEKENLPKLAKYKITLPDYEFTIIDAKTMIYGTSKYTVVSDNDFSSLF